MLFSLTDWHCYSVHTIICTLKIFFFYFDFHQLQLNSIIAFAIKTSVFPSFLFVFCCFAALSMKWRWKSILMEIKILNNDIHYYEFGIIFGIYFLIFIYFTRIFNQWRWWWEWIVILSMNSKSDQKHQYGLFVNLLCKWLIPLLLVTISNDIVLSQLRW